MGLTKFIRFVLIIQLMMIGVIVIDSTNLNLPLLRPLVGFIYLTFVPGILILNIFRFQKLNVIEFLLFSVGLSLAFLMFLGLIINTLYPIIGFYQPFSIASLTITLTIAVIIMCLIISIKEKDLLLNRNCRIKLVLSPSVLVLLIIPFISIFGSYFVNFYNNSILLFILFIIISIIPFLIIFFDWPKVNLYPLLIYVSSISLLYHWSLITSYLTGSDIHFEYYFANLVKTNSFWSSITSSNLNAMASVVILPPIYSNILNVDIIYVFKIIYPLIYSLIPLGIYWIYQSQINKKIAILSAFYFISIAPFFSEMLQLARQQIAELFYVLIILTITTEKVGKVKKSFMLIIFSFALVISHYGLSYIYFLLIFIVYLILILAKKLKSNMIFDSFNKHYVSFDENNIINRNYILLLFTFLISWYLYVSNSNAFNTIVYLGEKIISNINTDFFDTHSSQSLALIINNQSFLHKITKYLYFFSQFLILIGIIRLFIESKSLGFTIEYKAFSIANVFLLILSLILPYFASALNMSRLYHITLFFLAPFCIIGGIYTLEILNIFLKNNKINFNDSTFLKIFSIFLCIFLLFNSGIIFELGNEQPSSIAFNSSFNYPRYNERENAGMLWIIIHKDNTQKIFADDYAKLLLNEFLPNNMIYEFEGFVTKESYFYLRERNIQTNKLTYITKNNTLANFNYFIVSDYTNNLNKIYNNGGSEILKI